jgi:hypothetical protein
MISLPGDLSMQCDVMRNDECGAGSDAGWGRNVPFWYYEHGVPHGNSCYFCPNSASITACEATRRNMGDIRRLCACSHTSPPPQPPSAPLSYRTSSNGVNSCPSGSVSLDAIECDTYADYMVQLNGAAYRKTSWNKYDSMDDCTVQTWKGDSSQSCYGAGYNGCSPVPCTTTTPCDVGYNHNRGNNWLTYWFKFNHRVCKLA